MPEIRPVLALMFRPGGRALAMKLMGPPLLSVAVTYTEAR
jgi:hypothetical protein